MNCDEEHLLFRSGFESGTHGLPDDAHEVITGQDHSVALPNDWNILRARLRPPHPWALPGPPAAQRTHSPQLGYFDIQYMGGTVEDRFARVIADPTEPGNSVLHFSIARANEPISDGRSKARIQSCIYENQNLTAMRSRVRMYLHPDLAVLREWEQGFDWLTLQEYWFEPGWTNAGHPFRISVGLCRDPGAGEKPFHFSVHGQPGWEAGLDVCPGAPGWALPTWDKVQREFSVPTGTWLELETCYRQGGEKSGRFRYRLRAGNGPWVELFNVTDWTYNPRSESPAPLWGWSPMKLYTSMELIDYVRSRGGTTQAYWDDLAIHSDWTDN